MKAVGIRELKQHASQILRRVREERATYDITYHGEVIARLVPVTPAETTAAEIAAVLTDLEALAAEISASWPENVTVGEAIDDVRRDL